VYIDEPSVEDTIEMLKGLKDRYEEHHKITISDSALEAAARLSHRYLTDRFLPDKAIDLIDEAASKLRIDMESAPPEIKAAEEELARITREEETASAQREYERAAQLKQERLAVEERYNQERDRWLREAKIDGVVDEEDIAGLISKWTGIPVTRMLEEEAQKLLQMEERLHERIIGQDEAISAISDAVRRGRAGLKDPRRPIGSFIFLGPTGVGKTELGKALAQFLFDDEEAMIRMDMSEYMEKHTVSRLIGAPPGYIGYEEGGQLTEAVRRRPYRVILLDEVEKAHPDVFNILLQILEDGRLTDGHGRTVDFKNTVVIMTSNVGTEAFKRHQSLGFGRSAQPKDEVEKLRSVVGDALRQTFRPEFLNRIDEVIIFSPLSEEDIKAIVDIQIKDVMNRLEDQRIAVELTEAARSWLAKEGYDPEFGARPLRRAIQRNVENELSKRILQGEFTEGDTVLIDAGEEGLVFSRKPIEAEVVS
jgi:ATP-dependent Clp protease ATP-binding subunit ClpC